MATLMEYGNNQVNLLEETGVCLFRTTRFLNFNCFIIAANSYADKKRKEGRNASNRTAREQPDTRESRCH